MKKTTVYLPEELKASLARLAVDERRSEAEIIREAVAEKIERRTRPRPTLPLNTAGLGDAEVAERVDELLAGFGSE